MISAYICAHPGCSSPVWVDRNGRPSQYCLLSHMKLLSRRSPSQLCKHCHARPVYVEPGKVHDFCGRTCANAHLQSGGGGLTRPAKSRSDMCLLCGQHPRALVGGTPSDFCSVRCREDVFSAAPAILEVPSSQEEFRSVAAQFKDQWKNATSLPSVVAVYKIYSHPNHMKNFLAYKAAVGNSRRRWHGTTRSCTIGDNPRNTGFCAKPDCWICSILQNSFQLVKAGQNTGLRHGRFGMGIYTSATSSKSNDYIREQGGSSYKAMLLNEVIMGKAYKLPFNNTSLTQPPPGYDSVVGEPGLALNDDEAIVYRNEAIRPLYLVIFAP